VLRPAPMTNKYITVDHIVESRLTTMGHIKAIFYLLELFYI